MTDHSRPALPLDVQLHILSYLTDRSDVFSFMLTSREAYRSSHLHYLRLPLRFDDSGKEHWGRLRQFLQYMLDHPSHCHLIKYLEIEADQPLPAGIIEIVFKHFPSLEQLSVPSIEGQIIPSPNNQTETIPPMEFQKLQRLEITYATANAVNMLKYLHAPLRSVSIAFARSRAGRGRIELPVIIRNPIIFMVNFRTTLEVLSIVRGSWNQPFSSSLQYPNLRELNLQNTPPPYNKVAISFPNLKRLTLMNSIHGLPMAPRPRIDAWSHLEYVRGSLSDLYSLGLSGKVHHLYGVIDYLPDLRRTLEAVQETRPTLLVLDIKNPFDMFVTDSNEDYGVVDLRPMITYDELRHFSVQLDVAKSWSAILSSPKGEYGSFKEIMDKTLKFISAAKSVTHLTLSISWIRYLHVPNCCSQHASQGLAKCDCHSRLKALETASEVRDVYHEYLIANKDAILVHLVENLPSLEYIVLDCVRQYAASSYDVLQSIEGWHIAEGTDSDPQSVSGDITRIGNYKTEVLTREECKLLSEQYGGFQVCY
ncbi:hypothetical protein C8Q75DRAFT_730637 [Abortiporus biennis]|nr:hypothetical protein C8Q75DRAFT_730637 [Abortiporus biennis]